ncbi:hypothetical protein [Caulobacter sp. NIBR1757]|uniref:hypothetical protein n=1 Tax=Caulobacter sp. NIBR1757 TaxID=3016000 RepID=UPI0022F07ECB|nr:hypothetical protein [Caulobacter sp. NIBR1757]WGM39266.1 hypothetical protein AMEJIAPC_02183 [Caulobacter sp. NIBR1757]
MTVHVTLELTEEQKARLEAEAARQQVSLEVFMVNAAEIQVFRGSDAWIAAVQEGIEDFEAGRTFSQEEVVGAVEALLREKGAPPPA